MMNKTNIYWNGHVGIMAAEDSPYYKGDDGNISPYYDQTCLWAPSFETLINKDKNKYIELKETIGFCRGVIIKEI